MKSHVTRSITVVAAGMLLFLAAATPASAETQVIHDQSTFSVFVPCANGGLGENVDGLVKVHGVFSITDDGAGGFHVRIKLTFKGSGLGDVSGDTYRLHADIPEFFFPTRLNETAGGASNGAFDFSIDAIGQGGAPNLHFRQRAQFTMNANGVVTMDMSNLDESCN
jgi:hypothetical protein